MMIRDVMKRVLDIGEGSENNNEVMRNGMEMIGYVRGVCRSE